MGQFAKPGKRILLVEDDEAARQSIKLLLSIDRHLVTEAKSGQEALCFFTGERFDLVITDYFMPDMPGNEVAASIKSIAPSQPILMISAFSEKLCDVEIPVDAVLGKPFAIDELRQAIVKLVS
jgi:CheY-like chemotaxis protein